MYLIMGMCFLISAISGPMIIRKVKALNVSQTERQFGLDTHLGKQGTPIMGGFIFLISLLLFVLGYGISLLAGRSEGNLARLTVLILSTLMFGFIGFMDDYIKSRKKRNLGLNSKQKLLLQFAFAFGLVLFYYLKEGSGLRIPILGIVIDFGWVFVPLVMVAMVGTVNSVNLTDGVDGLAASVTIVFLFFYLVFGEWSQMPEISKFSMALIGSLMGFLLYNRYPAKIFMGDTGSMALGGAVAALALVSRTTLFIPIVGLIYLLEALSVMIQVFWYRRTKKRIFLMAPIHHHYEKKGMSEMKVVAMFTLVQLAMTIFGVSVLTI